MTVRVLFFSYLTDIVGSSELVRHCKVGSTVSDLWADLAAEFPALADAESAIRFAVNIEYSSMTATLHDGDEVAIMPPVQGG